MHLSGRVDDTNIDANIVWGMYVDMGDIGFADKMKFFDAVGRLVLCYGERVCDYIWKSRCKKDG